MHGRQLELASACALVVRVSVLRGALGRCSSEGHCIQDGGSSHVRVVLALWEVCVGLVPMLLQARPATGQHTAQQARSSHIWAMFSHGMRAP